MMKKHFDRKGFTLAEVLIVVAIIVVLAGVGFIALFAHMRTMHQLEMDGHAKEIFVAAQNHLTLADSQGYLGVAEFDDSGTSTGKFGTLVDADDNIYYIIVNEADTFSSGLGSEVLNQMLPFGSADESARTGGSYIIRYQKGSATVLDVFYVSTSGRYSLDAAEDKNLDYDEAMALAGEDNKKARRDDYKEGKTVLGWYGGAEAAALLKGEPLVAPGLQVLNGDKLEVIVTDNNVGSKNAGNQLNLIITGANGQSTFALPDDATRTISTGVYAVTLDDVTSAAGHFTSWGASSGFVPGENIDIKAVAFNNTLITNIAESSEVTTNSLFADVIQNDANENVAKIGYLRHLINLDSAISRLGITVKYAEQTADLSWTDFKTNVEQDAPSICPPSGGGASSEAGYFLPVDISSLTYDGKSFKISDIAVNYNSVAGLFGTVSNCTVKDLELVDFTIQTSGSAAGALAGSISGSTVSGVLVHNRGMGGADSSLAIISTGSDGAAGGLVGSMTGGSVQASAAAVYVKAATGDAGGLIGTATGATVESSYAGGHTQGTKYLTTDGDGVTARVNVIGGASAGGLIGSATNTGISNSYTTASVKGATPGGFIGTRSGGTINNVYASGLVVPATEGGKPYPFIGNGGTEQTGITNASYLLGVTTVVMNDQRDVGGITPVSSGVANTAFSPETKASAVVYDPALGVQYAFKTIDQLGGVSKPGITDRHYGDWQLPTLEILHYTLVNSDTLYTDIDLKPTTQYVTLALYGETSKEATVYRLKINEARNDADIVDRGTLKKETNGGTEIVSIEWIGEESFAASAGSYKLPANGVSSEVLHVALDDITTAYGHFASVFPELLPGENVTLLVAGGKPSWSDLDSLRTKTYPEEMDDAGNIIALSDNSIFAKAEALTTAETAARTGSSTKAAPYADTTYATALAGMSNAEIINYRHLQNLDADTSNVNAIASTMTDAEITAGTKLVTAAKLMNDLDWSAWSSSVYKYNAATSAANFNGIYNPSLTMFTGNYKSIKNLVIGNTYGEAANSAGFFRKVASGQTLEIRNLYLDSPKMTARAGGGGDAGAFAAISEGTLTLKNVLVQGDKDHSISAPGSVGGLVGVSKGTLTIDNSAASMLLDGGSAGGLLGHQAAGRATITNSYVGGHVTNRKYFVGTPVSGSEDERWNIMATGAAGGLIGETESGCITSIENTFNAASVYSTNSGSAGGLIGVAGGSFATGAGSLQNVYVVAPVNNVKTIAETDGSYTATAGGSGSALGQISSSLLGVQAYYLLDAYSNPYPVQYTDDYSNIMPVGSYSDDLALADIVSAIKPASYYETGTGERSIIGMTDIDALVVKTQPFNGSNIGGLEQYPFKIWTHLAFDSRGASDDTVTDENIENYPLYYYGDWQPNPNETMVVLDLHFVAVIPDNADTSVNEYRVLQVPEKTGLDHVRVQIPYRTAELALGWPEEVTGYSLGSSWDVYIGKWYSAANQTNWNANKINVMAGDAYKESDYYVATYNVGDNVKLPAADFQKINQDTYYERDDQGVPHIHLTCVSNYTEQDYALFTLSFYDKVTDADNKPTAANAENPCGTVVLKARRVDLPSIKTLKDLLEAKDASGNELNKDIVPPTRYLDGYRFMGWKTTLTLDGAGSTSYDYLYQNTFNAASQKFALGSALSTVSIPITGEGQDIKVYAEYEKIEERTLKINFVDKDGKPLGDENYQVPAYEIPFEADRGFQMELTLPTWGVDVPDSISPSTNVTTKTANGKTVPVGFDETPPKITFTIPAVENAAVTNGSVTKILEYTIKYKKGEQAGYVVLFQLLDTKADGSYDPAGGSIVDPSEALFTAIQDRTYLWGVTNPGEKPNLNLGDTTLRQNLTTYLNGLVGGAGRFELASYTNASSGNKEPYRLVKLADGVPTDCTDCYPSQVTDDSGEHNVSYLIVLQCARVKHELSYDSDEGSDVGTELVEYGRPLDFLDSLILTSATAESTRKPVRVNYEFLGWHAPNMGNNEVIHGKYTPEGEDEIPSNIPEMPSRNMTVQAIWQGKPVGFTVAFWYENPKNTDDTDYSYVGKRVYTEAEGKTAGTRLSSADYSNAFDGVNSYMVNPANGREERVSLDTAHFAYYAGKQDTVKLKADGSSVLNVYYNRKNVYITFTGKYKTHTRNNLNETKYDYFYVGTTNTYPLVKELDNTPYFMTDHTYTATTSNDGTQFGLVNGEYTQLRKEDATEYVWSPDWEYYDAPDSTTQNVFGLVGSTYKEYEPLTYVSGGYVRAAGTSYQSTTDGFNGSDQYWKDDDGFKLLYYSNSNKNWYKERTWNAGKQRYDYSNKHNGIRYRVVTTSGVGYSYTGDVETLGSQQYGSSTSGGNTTYFPVTQESSGWVYNSWNTFTTRTEGYYFVQVNGTYVYRYMYPGTQNWYFDEGHSWNQRYSGTVYLSAPYDGDRYLRRQDSQIFGDDDQTRYSQSGDPGSHAYTAVAADNHNGEQYYKDSRDGYIHLTGSGDEKYNWYWTDGTDEHLYTGTRYTEGDGARYDGQHFTRSGDGAPYAYTPVASDNWTGSPDHYAADNNVEDTEGAPTDPQRHGHTKLTYVQPTGQYVWVYYDENGGRHIYEDNTFAYFSNESGAKGPTTMKWTGKWESPFVNNHYSWDMVDAYRWQEADGTTQTYMEAFINDEFTDNDNDYTYELSFVGEKGEHLIRHYKEGTDGLYHVDTENVDYVNAYSINQSGTFNFSNKFPYFTVSSYTASERHQTLMGDYYTDPEFSATGGNALPNDMKKDVHYPLYVYHSRNAYTITFINGTSVVKTVTGVKYEKALGEIGNLVPADPTARPAGLDADYTFKGWCVDATMTGKTVWFGNDKSGTFSESSMMTMNMPGGNLVLYAKWARDPVDVVFSLSAPKLLQTQKDEDGEETTSLVNLTGVTLRWKDDSTADKEFLKREYGSTLDEIVDTATGQLKDEYKPRNPNGYTFLYWATADGKRFYNTQALTQSYTKIYNEGALVKDDTLYPVFEVETSNTLSVDVYYKLGDETKLDHTESVTIGTTPTITLRNPPSNVPAGYKLDPPYFFETIDEAWKTNHYNSATGKYELTFNYIDASTAWDYTVEYCLMLKPADGGAKEAVRIMTQSKHADSEYAFEAFYSLPGGMRGGYQFTELELRKGGSPQGARSTDPTILLKKGDADTIRVFVEPVVNASITDAITRVYNGQSQALAEESIREKLPNIFEQLPQGSTVLTADNVSYEIVPTYYFGNTKISESNVKDAGVYRLDIQVRLVCNLDAEGSQKKYVFWQTDEYSSGGHPGIVFTINRRKVQVTSNDVTNIFYDDGSENGNRQYFADGGTPVADWLPDGAKLGTLAQDTTQPIPVVERTDVDTDDIFNAIDSLVKSKFRCNFSADAFRRAPSEDKAAFTANAFTYTLNGLDQNNFDVYMIPGRLYLWKDKDAYESLNSGTP